ncbi:hypothetical protein [Cycloclasticus pugetii]|uniref:hypothetical protein n=1 Tax=Cycloclasticus pugetii TaxID=34068 RepID=UPI00240A5480|nr:hypothetical protein [Cycloclasticus pugetii]MDF1830605.1 hypothetical protein [Cycloclasticus pugetii]
MNATHSTFQASPTTDDGSLVYLTLDAISVEDGVLGTFRPNVTLIATSYVL